MCNQLGEHCCCGKDGTTCGGRPVQGHASTCCVECKGPAYPSWLNYFKTDDRPPAPAPPSDLTFVDVFCLNKTLNTCYIIPLIIYTAVGTLLAIAEERFIATTCPDNYKSGEPGGHNQVTRRSTDMGACAKLFVTLPLPGSMLPFLI